MAIQGGPDIVEDGLVLHLDAAEPLCFRGEPTTNVVANPNPTSGWGGSNSQGSTITRSFLTENGVPFMRFSGVTNGSDYPRVTDSVFTNSATITGSFSTSLEARGTSGAQIRLRIYDNSSTKITNTITLTNEWVRYKFENQSTSFALNQPYFNPVTTGATYDIRNIQIEAKPYSTSFVVGTRGSTVATGGGLLDITNNGNNGTINRAASPSAAFYSGDNKGSFVFDGSNDYVTVGTSPNSMNFSSGSTISVWVKVLSNTSGLFADNTVLSKWWDGSVRGFNITASSNSASIAYRPSNSGGDISLAYTPGASFFSNWNFLSFVNSSLRIDMYSNGLLVDFLERNDTFIRNNSADLRVGRYTHTSLNGYSNSQVSNVSIYNKALTASEIQQNFNATKGRYGL